MLAAHAALEELGEQQALLFVVVAGVEVVQEVDELLQDVGVELIAPAHAGRPSPRRSHDQVADLVLLLQRLGRPSREHLGKLRVALPYADGDFLAFDRIEAECQLLLVLVGEQLIGHGEEDLLLMGDVGTHQFEVGIELGRQLGRIAGAGLLHRPQPVFDVAQARVELLVLAVELGQDAGVVGQSAQMQAREEKVLLLGIVAALGEVLEEIDQLVDDIGAVLPGIAHVADLLLGRLRHEDRERMLSRQCVGRSHGRLPLAVHGADTTSVLGSLRGRPQGRMSPASRVPTLRATTYGAKGVFVPRQTTRFSCNGLVRVAWGDARRR